MTKKVTRRAKKCPYCESLHTIKKGVRKDTKIPITRYLCKTCGRKFQEKRRKKNLQKKVFEEYFWNKRTLRELSEMFSLNRKTIQNYIHKYKVTTTKKKPRTINLIVDVIFFSKRKFHTEFGVMVFYDSLQEEVIAWRVVENEKLSDYREMYFQLYNDGFVIQSVVIDGKRGLQRFFEQEGLIIQYCHFHQIQTILRYITRNPKHPALKQFKRITERLTEVTREEFIQLFYQYLETWKDYIQEQQLNTETGKYYYVHRRLRSAIASLKRNIPYLFTYLDYPELHINNTTNLLDGGEFSYLKRLLRNHNGCSRELKLKMIDEYFENHKNKRKNRV